MQLGIIGLGKMGSRIALKLLKEGHEVVVWNRSKESVDEFKSKIPRARLSTDDTNQESIKSLTVVDSIKELTKNLQKPRAVWLMLPAGEVTESVLAEVGQFVEPGDIVIDGGNAFYKDTQRRSETFKINNIRFLGIGVSGGIKAVENGYPLMVGGEKTAYDEIVPLLDSLARPNGGHHFFGEGGAGHFVKMVHNGIEYGMMQAIGEGYGVLDKAPYELDLKAVAKLWQQGTIVESFLNGSALSVLEQDSTLTTVDGVIEATGEAEWTVKQAEVEDIDIPVIKESLRYRALSKVDEKIRNSFAARMVASLRNEFGGHVVKKK